MDTNRYSTWPTLSEWSFPPAERFRYDVRRAGSFSESLLGSWEVGDGTGNNFEIKLNDDAAPIVAGRRPGNVAICRREARVTWSDGNKDCIRKVGTIYRKFAYSAGKSFTSDLTTKQTRGIHRPSQSR